MMKERFQRKMVQTQFTCHTQGMDTLPNYSKNFKGAHFATLHIRLHDAPHLYHCLDAL
jgi:hypothetical protein